MSGERPIIRRLKLFAVALIAPELIVLWALRQWLSSRRLAQKYKKFGWTQTHGFFAIMGGFQVCPSDGSMEPFALDTDDIGPCLENRDITISEQDIQDKSKGDALAKLVVVLQANWFILQVIARVVKHLPITELEIATLAFAILNFVTYFCWWNKPLDVNCPIKLTIDYVSPRVRSVTSQFTPLPSTIPGLNTVFHPTIYEDDGPSLRNSSLDCGTNHGECRRSLASSLRHEFDDHSHPRISLDSASQASADGVGCPSHMLNSSWPQSPAMHSLPAARCQNEVHCSAEGTCHPRLNNSPVSPTLSLTLPEKALCSRRLDTPRTFSSSAQKIDAEAKPAYSSPNCSAHRRWSILSTIWMALKDTGSCLPQAILSVSWKFLRTTIRAINTCVDFTTREFQRLVLQDDSPDYLFGTLSKAESVTGNTLACGMAVVFGAVHCLAWHSEFPTKYEEAIWRVSSTLITCLPLYAIFLHYFFVFVYVRLGPSPSFSNAETFLQWAGLRRWLLFYLFLPTYRIGKVLYFSARLVLLVQMFMLLRKPSPGIFTSVNWLAYIPHL